MHSKKWTDALNKTALLFSRTLEPDEWEIWGGFLEKLNPKAVEYAFENWQRNGRFFPKPKEILELVDAYKLSSQPSSRFRYEHHGEGYNETDIGFLWTLYKSKRESTKRELTNEEIDVLLGELDSKRGRTPAWRMR